MPALDRSVGGMDAQDTQGVQASGEPSAHECECPEPCNCDHDNE